MNAILFATAFASYGASRATAHQEENQKIAKKWKDRFAKETNLHPDAP